MSATILIVDDEENFRQNMMEYLTGQDYEVLGVATLQEARECLALGKGDIVLLDVTLKGEYGPVLLEETAHLPSRPPIILITAYGEIDMAVDAMKNGAHDFLQKPIQFHRLEKSLARAREIVAMRRELEHYRRAQQKNLNFVIGQSAAMQTVVDKAQRAAAAAASILITGESGTGKEVLARSIHQMGPRADKQFIDINCAAMQPTMVESELFGHEAGAFTGAVKRKPGLMEVADTGILFLDEISTMSLDMQAKLLRALAERSFRRVGGTNLIKVDVQVIAASNKDLKAMLKSGEFREDLYYRLKVVDLHLPPLRERKVDIPELAGSFIRQLNLRYGQNVRDVSPRAMEALMSYDWPGNIRELLHAIEHAMLFCDAEVIDLPHLPVDVAGVHA